MVVKIEQIGADTLAEARRMRAQMEADGTPWSEGQAVSWYEQHYATAVDVYDPVRTGIRVAFRSLGAMNFALAAGPVRNSGKGSCRRRDAVALGCSVCNCVTVGVDDDVR